MTKAFELAQLGDKVVVDGSGNLSVDGSTLFVDAVNNLVGIGTITPSRILTVNGERAQFNETLVGISTPMQIRNGSATNNGRGTGLEFVGPSNTFGRIEGFWSGTDERIRLFSTGSTTISTGGTERLRITSTGSVGIGTISPSAGLHVNGGAFGSGTGYQLMVGYLGGSENYYDANTQIFRDGSANERMRITSTGSVGIGTSSPTPLYSRALHIESSTNAGIRFTNGTATAGFDVVMGAGGEGFLFNRNNQPVIFATNNTERARIDASGNLLVGKTAVDNTTAGHRLDASGFMSHVRDGNAVALYNRKTSDGDIMLFQKDGTTVGSIQADGGAVNIGSEATRLIFIDGSPKRIIPRAGPVTASDGLISLGDAGSRFKDLFLSSGVYLGGTGSANLLDDYETGTWTPSLNFGTSVVYGAREGTYTKVGRLVNVYFSIEVTSMSNADTSIIHIPMPFVPFANNKQCVVSIDGPLSTLIVQSVAGNSIGSGGVITNNIDLLISAQDADRLKYTDCNTSGLIEGAVTFMTT